MRLPRPIRHLVTVVLLWSLAVVPALAHGKAGMVEGVLEVALDQWSLGFEEIRVEPGGLTVHVINEGTFPHNLTLAVRRDGEEYAFGTPLLSPGGEAAFVVDLPEGEYELYCSVIGHKEAGMLAKLTVAAAEEEPPAARRGGGGGYY